MLCMTSELTSLIITISLKATVFPQKVIVFNSNLFTIKVLPADLGKESSYCPKPLCPDTPGQEVRVIGHDNLPATCLGSFDFLGLCNAPEIKEAAVIAMQEFGCGSCGPRGFYGTTRLHLELEKKLKEFFGTEEAILYSYAGATPCSVIPAFASAGKFPYS